MKFDTKKPAHNERFGATAAVTPQKVMCGCERKYPAELLLSAPLRQAATTLYANQREYDGQSTRMIESLQC